MSQLAVIDTTALEESRADLDLANAFAKAKMVPAHYKNSPGDCYIAIKLARRFRMDAWSVMQEMYLVQDRPMMSGKLAIAILNNSLDEPLRPAYAGDGDERTITLAGRPRDEAGSLSVTLKVKDAKTNNEQWKKNPDQMLMYSAARMWGRRFAPDILLGIVFDDEEIPAPFVPPKPTSRIQLPPQQPQHVDVIDELTGEVLDHPVVLPKQPDENWYNWGARLVACIRGAKDIDTVDQWLAINADALTECAKDAKKVSTNITSAVSQHKMNLIGSENTK